MDPTQSETKTPEQLTQASLHETTPTATVNVVEAQKSEGAKMETPEERQAKMEEAQAIRTAIVGLENLMKEQAAKAQQQEADVTKWQEAINRTLGQRDILGIVRKENEQYQALLSRQLDAMKQRLGTLEKDMGAVSSTPETSPIAPEQPVVETSKDLAPDKTAEAAAAASRPPTVGV